MAVRTILSSSPVYVEPGRLTDGLPTMHVAATGGRTTRGPVTWCGLRTTGMTTGVYEQERLAAQGCPTCFYELTLA